MPQFLPSQKLDFEGYKNSLKQYLKSQDKFKDYDFEGSNFSILLDILAYNAYNQAHYLNMVGSEMFLDSALLRESIVSQAKELNYTPRSRVSARALVNVQIFPFDSPEIINIPKNYIFKTNVNNNSVKFVNALPVTIKRNVDGEYISEEFLVYEGDVVREMYEVEQVSTQVNGTVRYSQRFFLQSENIDATSLEVVVWENNNFNVSTVFSRAINLYGLNGSSEVFFVQGYRDNYYEIEFGDGILGKALSQGNVIEIRYRNTIGENGNGLYKFSKSTSIDGYSDIYINTLSRATGGAERETNESIKFNAVRHFQTQERAVNESDFNSLIKENFPQVQQVSIYGGEKVQQYGKVYIVLKPYFREGVVDESTKKQIINFIKTKTLVPEPIIVDPEYYYLGVKSNVYYNVNYTQIQKTEVESSVLNKLIALNDGVLGGFNSIVYQSTVNEAIYHSHPAITGCDVDLSLFKQIIPSLGVARQYTYTLENKIKSSQQGVYSNNNEYGVRSNTFETIFNDEIINCIIQDNGAGLLHLYQIIDTNKIKIGNSIGTVDYDTGEVKFTIDIHQVSPNFYMENVLVDESLKVSLNKYVSIDSSYVSLNVEGR